jgi:L-lysine 6-transaminase
MVKAGFDSIFEKPEAGRLCITFDGDLTDMVRCRHIIKAIKELGLMENVNQRSAQLLNGLSNLPQVENFRSAGVIIGFDLENREKRDTFVSNLYKIGMICNSAGEKSVRLRPSLSVSSNEISLGIRLIKEALNEN